MYSRTSCPDSTSRILMLFPSGFLIALVLVVAQPVLPIHAENWPQWRGPTNNGISLESKLPVHWNRKHNVAWRVALPGRAGSTPVVWNGQLFLTSAEDDKLVVMSFDHAGKELWKRVVSSSRWSAHHATSLRNQFLVFSGAVGRWGRISGLMNFSAPLRKGP